MNIASQKMAIVSDARLRSWDIMNPNLLTAKVLDSRHSLLRQFKCAACSSRHVFARVQVVARGIQTKAGHCLATGISVSCPIGYQVKLNGYVSRCHRVLFSGTCF